MTLQYKKGISFTYFSTFFLIVLLLFYILLSFVSSRLNSKYESVQNTLSQFIICEQASQTLKDTTSYLTEQAQLFIMTHDEAYSQAYLNEKYVTKKRETAISKLLDATSNENASFIKLQIAMNQSESLSSIELYGMRLAYEAAGKKNIPEQLKTIEIKNSDLRSNSIERQAVAESKIYGSGYLLYKNRVNSNCNGIINDIENKIQTKLRSDAAQTQKLLNLFSILQLLVLVFSALFFVTIICLIILPLRKLTLSLRKKETMPVTGAEELRFLAMTYNEVNEFDVLTGSLSRRAFNELCNKFSRQEIYLCLILVDIDNFKKINDTYGHSKGDLVLTTVAQYLESGFRQNDYVSRIGGDEFAILCPNLKEHDEELFETKINSINKKFTQNPETKGIVSISAGIALSKTGYSKDLFANADKALYTAKAKGKGCGHIFSEIL